MAITVQKLVIYIIIIHAKVSGQCSEVDQQTI